MNNSFDMEIILNVLDGSDTTTGGGSASSISGAMAAGLTAMVAKLSIKQAAIEKKQFYTEIFGKADKLIRKLWEGAVEDSKAFSKVSSAYKMPKNTAEENKKRSQAIQDGMVHAARVPLMNAEGCKKVLDLAVALMKDFNKNAASDLECAINMSFAGFKGCVANVEINLPYIKDEAIVGEIKMSLHELTIQVEKMVKKGGFSCRP